MNVVRAAGGIVQRMNDGVLELLVVHRPRYNDWTFPKGKAEGDESDEDCARREVEEETGLRCRLGRELPSTRYHDHKRRPKVVRYWVMEPVAGDVDRFIPTPEVDAIRWVTPGDAVGLLSYEHDRDLARGL